MVSSFQVQEKRLNSKVKSIWDYVVYCLKIVCWCACADTVYVQLCVYAWVNCAVLEYACIAHAHVNAGTYVSAKLCVNACVKSHSCGLDFVPRRAHPSRVVRQSLTLFSLQTWFHLTPPFSNYNRRCGRWVQIQNKNRLVYHPDTCNTHIPVFLHATDANTNTDKRRWSK